MDDLTIHMAQLGAAGFCCSQILLLLALEAQGRDNPDLVRAAGGLCNGLRDCSQVCGALSGGQLVLALYAGKGSADEEVHDRWELMASELNEWFAETLAPSGVRCQDILGEGQCGKPDRERCGGIVAAVWSRCLELLTENGVDPSEGKGV